VSAHDDGKSWGQKSSGGRLGSDLKLVKGPKGDFGREPITRFLLITIQGGGRMEKGRDARKREKGRKCS